MKTDISGRTRNSTDDQMESEKQDKNTEKHSSRTNERHCDRRPPRRYIFTLLSFIGCTMAVMFNTNLSIVIVYMVNRNASVPDVPASNECIVTTEEYKETKYGEFLWSPKTEGLAIAAAFYGHVVALIPGGRLAELWGGKKTIISSLLLSSLMTMLLPVAAHFSAVAFIFPRFLIGIGTASVVPVLLYLISHWIPVNERCFHASIIFAGYPFGSFLSVIIAGFLCGTDILGGWPSVFYFGGAAGLLWCILYYFLFSETPQEHPTISDSELHHILSGLDSEKPKRIKAIPWKSMFTSIPMWALAAGFFGQFWIVGFFSTVHSLYMGTILNINSVKNGQLSSIPHVLRGVFSCLCSYPADWAVKKKIVGVAFVRKGVTLINSVVAIIGFVGIMLSGCDIVLNTVFFTISGITGDFLSFGIVMACNDIAPNLTATVNGILNIIGTAPYFIIPAIVGWLTTNERTMAQWRWVYFITIGVIAITTIIFVVFGSSEPQPWGTIREDVATESPRKKQQNMTKIRTTDSRKDVLPENKTKM